MQCYQISAGFITAVFELMLLLFPVCVCVRRKHSSEEIGNFAYRGNLIPPYKSSLKVSDCSVKVIVVIIENSSIIHLVPLLAHTFVYFSPCSNHLQQ